MLNEAMQTLIRDFNAGAVATVNADGTPSVSPKATFVVLDGQTLAFGHIRSPRTVANLRRNPAIEICFTDVLRRRALRVTGRAEVVPRDEAAPELVLAFTRAWPDYVGRMRAFVVVRVTRVEEILSPAYDIGLDEAELVRSNFAKLEAARDRR